MDAFQPLGMLGKSLEHQARAGKARCAGDAVVTNKLHHPEVTRKTSMSPEPGGSGCSYLVLPPHVTLVWLDFNFDPRPHTPQTDVGFDFSLWTNARFPTVILTRVRS